MAERRSTGGKSGGRFEMAVGPVAPSSINVGDFVIHGRLQCSLDLHIAEVVYLNPRSVYVVSNGIPIVSACSGKTWKFTRQDQRTR
jgi:hypothetical protein